MKIDINLINNQEYCAENLRKNNKIEESIDLLKPIKKTVYGYTVLAKCYEDIQEYHKAFIILKDIFDYGKNNVFFLKSFINISMKNSEYIYAKKAIILLRDISNDYKNLNQYLNQINDFLKKI